MISVICGVRNRTKSLVEVLPTWLDAEGVKEIVITDWNSEDPFIYNHEKVHIVRVRDVGYWSLTQALNIAARFAHENIYAKLDADSAQRTSQFMGSVLQGVFKRASDSLGTFIFGEEEEETLA